MKLKSLVVFIFIGMLFSCEKENSSGNNGNIKIGGQEYNFTHGAIWTYGFTSEWDGYRRSIALLTEDVNINKEDGWTGEGKILAFAIYSSNSDINGEYVFSDNYQSTVSSSEPVLFITLKDNYFLSEIDMTNGDNIVITKTESDYQIIFKNIELSNGNIINGTYSGELQEMID
jgi:hypothetical protein